MPIYELVKCLELVNCSLEFDDDLKEKILDYYHEYIGSRWETNEDVADLTRFME